MSGYNQSYTFMQLQQSIPDWVANNQKKALAHSCRGWSLKSWSQPGWKRAIYRFLLVSSCGQSDWETLGGLFSRGSSHSWGWSTHALLTFWRPHLLTPSRGLEDSHTWILWGQEHSDQSRTRHYLFVAQTLALWPMGALPGGSCICLTDSNQWVIVSFFENPLAYFLEHMNFW